MIAYGTPTLFYLPMLTASGNPDTAQTPTVQISKDGGAYAAAAGTLTRLGTTHVWTYLPTVAESQTKVLNVLATATGDIPYTTTQYTEDVYTAAKAALLDASISGVAASVWAYVTRTLTSFGTLADDVAAIKAKVIALQTLVDVATSTAATPEEVLGIVQDAVDAVVAQCANPASPTPVEQQQIDTLALIYAAVQASETEPSAATRHAATLAKISEVLADLETLARPEDAMTLTAATLASVREGLATTADAMEIQQAVQALPTPATPADLVQTQQAIIAALPPAPDNAGIASILQRVQQLQGITITMPSLPVPVELGKLPKVQANTWCELPITITNLEHQEGDQYRYVLRYAAYGRDPVIINEVVPEPTDGGYQFTLRFAAPAAQDAYQLGIERRRMVDGHPQDTPIATGALVVTADIVRPVDWTANG